MSTNTDERDKLAKYGGGTLEVVNGAEFDAQTRCAAHPYQGANYDPQSGGAYCAGLLPATEP